MPVEQRFSGYLAFLCRSSFSWRCSCIPDIRIMHAWRVCAIGFPLCTAQSDPASSGVFFLEMRRPGLAGSGVRLISEHGLI